MKIEKINDNQIRCTLNKEDLIDRQLRISELAYGTEKAKNLFRDMMQQASYEFGFEADDIPLMIEAIPISGEALVLIITKVEDPDELDTRFSKFSIDRGDSSESLHTAGSDDSNQRSYADEILHCFGQLDRLLEAKSKTNSGNQSFIPLANSLTGKTNESKKETNEKNSLQKQNFMKVYSFHTLDDVTKLAHVIFYSYEGKNSLYKNEADVKYYLVTYKSEQSPEEYNKICNIISEYGKPERTTYVTSSYFEEHFKVIIRDNAIQTLAKV